MCEWLAVVATGEYQVNGAIFIRVQVELCVVNGLQGHCLIKEELYGPIVHVNSEIKEIGGGHISDILGSLLSHWIRDRYQAVAIHVYDGEVGYSQVGVVDAIVEVCE